AFRDQVTRALAQVGPPAVPELLRLLEHEEPAVRLCALKALARVGPEAAKAVPALRKALKDTYAGCRARAAAALGEVGPAAKDAAPDLVGLLTDLDAVHTPAMQALAKLGAPAVPPLCKALKDKSAVRRARAARTLALMGPDARAGTAALAEALADKSAE